MRLSRAFSLIYGFLPSSRSRRHRPQLLALHPALAWEASPSVRSCDSPEPLGSPLTASLPSTASPVLCTVEGLRGGWLRSTAELCRAAPGTCGFSGPHCPLGDTLVGTLSPVACCLVPPCHKSFFGSLWRQRDGASRLQKTSLFRHLKTNQQHFLVLLLSRFQLSGPGQWACCSWLAASLSNRRNEARGQGISAAGSPGLSVQEDMEASPHREAAVWGAG